MSAHTEVTAPTTAVSDDTSLASKSQDGTLHGEPDHVDTSRNGWIAVAQLCSTNDLQKNYEVCFARVHTAEYHHLHAVCVAKRHRLFG